MSGIAFERVVDCIAATTRYPKELLTGDADLESDLGIDSVKRVEIVAALAEEFGLDLQTQERDPNIRTINNVTQWICGMMSSGSAAPNGSPAKLKQDSRLSVPTQPGVGQQVASPIPPSIELPGSDLPEILSQRTRPSAAHPRVVPRPKYVEVGQSQSQSQSASTSGAKSLEGQIALVTGSGRSVGRTIARVLASRGATVIVNSFHSRDEGEKTTAEIVANGGEAFHVWGSVANPEHVDNIFAQIEERFGSLDILVCNASDGRIGSFAELTPDDWDRAFRTNVSGHYQCAMRAAPLMQPRGGGSIVTMSAVGAHRFIDGLGSQGVVKAAVETMTKYLACTLSSYGVRTNCVCGGPVYGELISKFPAAVETQRHWEAMMPGRELSSPMDLARTISFLVSDEARGINGAVWQVDQGFSAIADGRPLQAPPERVATSSTF